jgi:hypothetical protein
MTKEEKAAEMARRKEERKQVRLLRAGTLCEMWWTDEGRFFL